MRPLRPGPRAIVTATYPQVSAVWVAHLLLRIDGSSRWVSPAGSSAASKSASVAGSTVKRLPRLVSRLNGSSGVSAECASPRESSVQRPHTSPVRSSGRTWVRLPTAAQRSGWGHPPASPPRTGSSACQRLASPPFPPGPRLRVLGSLLVPPEGGSGRIPAGLLLTGRRKEPKLLLPGFSLARENPNILPFKVPPSAGPVVYHPAYTSPDSGLSIGWRG